MAHLRCDSCARTETLDGPRKLGEVCPSCNVGAFRLAGPEPIGYIFQEGKTAYLGTIQAGFYVRLLTPSGRYLDVRVDGESITVIAPSRDHQIGIIFDKPSVVRVGFIEK